MPASPTNNATVSKLLRKSHTPIFMELGQFSSPIVYLYVPNEDDPLPAKWGLFVVSQLCCDKKPMKSFSKSLMVIV